VVALLKYSVLRLALFVGLLAVFAVLGAGKIVALIGAALVSMMLSYLFLRRPRDEVTAVLAERMEHRAARRGPSASAQDEALEDAVVDGTVEAPARRRPGIGEAHTPEAHTPEAHTPEAGTPEAGTPEAGTGEADTRHG
jgi:Protein of unknown function (DUF4229)